MSIEFSPFKRVKTTTTYADGRKSSYESYAPNIGGFVSIMPMALVVIGIFYMVVAALKVGMILLLVLPFLIYVLHYKRKLKNLLNDSNFHSLDENIQTKIMSSYKYNYWITILVTIYLVAVMSYMSVLVFSAVDNDEINPFLIDAFVNPFYYTVLLSSIGLLFYHLTLAPFRVRKACKMLKDKNPEAMKSMLKRGLFQKLAFLFMFASIAIGVIHPPKMEASIKEPLKYPKDYRDEFRSFVNEMKFKLFPEFTQKDIEEQAKPDNSFYTFSIKSALHRNYIFHSYTLNVKPIYKSNECKPFKTILTGAMDNKTPYLFDGSKHFIGINDYLPSGMYLEAIRLKSKDVDDFYDVNIVTIEHPGIGGHDEHILADFKIGTFNWVVDDGTLCYGKAEVIPR